jgi:hypothetical protein
VFETLLRRLLPWISEGGYYRWIIRRHLAVNYIVPGWWDQKYRREMLYTRVEGDRYILYVKYGPGWDPPPPYLWKPTPRHVLRLSWMPRCGGLRFERW